MRTVQRVQSDLEELIAVLPDWVRRQLEARARGQSELQEVVLDLGRPPEVRFRDSSRLVPLSDEPVSELDIQHVVSRSSAFGDDNRAGIERTLHRIAAIRNRAGRIVGLSCRVGRAVFGTIDVIQDIVENRASVLLLGRPGVGKTTKLREIARILSTDLERRVVVVDTSNEIGGDGDIPHPAIGRARRMQVPHVADQHAIMIEAVENHMPEVIVIDEIGTSAEALAARTIAERGVQLVATAHGNTLDNVLANPTLCDMVGGVESVTLGDEEARRRGTQKTVLERRSPPTFSVLIEMIETDELAVHHDVGEAVDLILRGFEPRREIRKLGEGGAVETRWEEPEARKRDDGYDSDPDGHVPLSFLHRGFEQPKEEDRVYRIFPYGISRDRLLRAIQELRLNAVITKDPSSADLVVTLRAHQRRFSTKGQRPADAMLRYLRSNTYGQVYNCLQEVFRADVQSGEEDALEEARGAIQEVLADAQPMELTPQPRHIRRMQHELADAYQLTSRSVGRDPFRRVIVQRSDRGFAD